MGVVKYESERLNGASIVTTTAMARLQVEISEEMKDRVRIDAAVRNIPQGQLVTEALEMYFAAREKEQKTAKK